MGYCQLRRAKPNASLIRMDVETQTVMYDVILEEMGKYTKKHIVLVEQRL